jgi:hypothetical protein
MYMPLKIWVLSPKLKQKKLHRSLEKKVKTPIKKRYTTKVEQGFESFKGIKIA